MKGNPMKYVLVLLIAILFAACQSSPGGKTSLSSEKDSLSYSVGLQMGESLKLGADDMDIEALVKGIRDGMGDKEKMLTKEEVQNNFSKFQKIMTAKFQEDQKRKAEEGIVKGDEFLKENAQKEGVVTLPSGLQYKIIEAGSGPSPKATDQVVVHYRGRLLDGTQFDSSYDRGQPATFGVGQVIKGWTEGLQLMSTGAKWELYIPSELAYGARGAGQTIPPNSTLIFEVELLEIK